LLPHPQNHRYWTFEEPFVILGGKHDITPAAKRPEDFATTSASARLVSQAIAQGREVQWVRADRR
jgi:hypothetical protein